MSKKNSFIMLKEWGDQLQFLDDAQTAELMRMIFIYQAHPEDGVPVSDFPIVNSIFMTMRSFFDASEEKYSETCETNRKNGSKGGAPKGNRNAKKQPKTTQNNPKQPKTTENNPKQPKTTLYEYEYESEYESDIEYESEYESDTESVKEKVPKGTKKKSSRFTPPAVEDVEAYITDKGYSVSASAFVDYYSSNGWKVGKNPMKDWRAAVRMWQSREKSNSPPKDKSFSEIAQELAGGIV